VLKEEISPIKRRSSSILTIEAREDPKEKGESVVIKDRRAIEVMTVKKDHKEQQGFLGL
jgi:hypothetical protein